MTEKPGEKTNKENITIDKSNIDSNLSSNQLQFCILYNNTGNARQSYMKAFSTQNMNTAGVQGCRLLKKPNIIAQINRLKEETILKPG